MTSLPSSMVLTRLAISPARPRRGRAGARAGGPRRRRRDPAGHGSRRRRFQARNGPGRILALSLILILARARGGAGRVRPVLVLGRGGLAAGEVIRGAVSEPVVTPVPGAAVVMGP